MVSSVVKAEEEREGLRGLSNLAFVGVLILVAVAIFGITLWIGQSFAFFAAYVVVQYIVLGTAWNILGGYTGYVNFGIAALIQQTGSLGQVISLTAIPFVIGLAVIPFGLETKGRPLP